MDQLVYSLTVHYTIYSYMHSHLRQMDHLEMREYSEEITRLEKECDRYADQLVHRIVASYFQALSDFSASAALNQQLVLNIIMQLNESYTVKLQQIRQLLNKAFSGQQGL